MSRPLKIYPALLMIAALTAALCIFGGCAKDTVPSDISEEIAIVPQPLSVETLGGGFLLGKSRIFVENGDSETQRLADLLANLIEQTSGRRPSVTEGYDSGRDSSKMPIILSRSDQAAQEEYTIEITADHAVLSGRNAGLFYAIQVIRQLLPAESLGFDPKTMATALPAVRIRDIPRFSWRGMHLDVSRHFMPVDFVKRYIDYLAMHRMNIFHWHLTDGTGWRLAIDKYPLLTDKGAWRKDIRKEGWDFTKIVAAEENDPAPYGGFYTKDDVREILAYAAERYVTVIPEIEMPGHASAALYAYPEYLCSNADSTNREFRNSGVFCAGKEETFTFLEDILNEVIELFPSEYIHIGGDEVSKRFWKACPECQARMKAEGLDDEEELQSYFIRRIEKYLISKNRRLLGWDEILEGGLAPEATVMSWRGMQGGVKAAEQNHDVIMTPENLCYFNLYQGDPDLEPKAWGGYLPLNQVYSFDPVPEGLTGDSAKHVLGGQGCLWTEFVPTEEMAEYMILPRLSAMAEALWTPAGQKDWDSFRRRMTKQYRRFESLGVNYAKSQFNVYFDVAIDPDNFNATYSLVSDAAGLDMRYTLDGSDPTASSTLYDSPFELDESAVVKAASFDGDTMVSGVRSETYTRHLASGKKPVLSLDYSSRFPGEGEYTLTNCRYGSKAYGDGQWQGFLGSELVVDIDLGAVTDVSEVAVTSNHNPSVWLFMAEGLTVELSRDGKKFTPAATVKNETDQQTKGPIISELKATFAPVAARHVRARIKGLGKCPEWHVGSGAAAWLFVDEVVVK